MSTGDTSGFSLKYYKWKITNAEAAHPTGTTGWSIANVVRSKSGSNVWGNLSGDPTGLVHIAADD